MMRMCVNVFFKKSTFFIPTLLCAISLNFVNAQEFEKIDELIHQKKYESAFQILHEKDKNYNDPKLVHKMSVIATNYYAKCIMGRIFSFEDLKEGQTLDQIRQEQGTYKVYPFEIEKHLNKLIRKYPRNLELKISLADYYYSGICGLSESKIQRAEGLYDSVYGKTKFPALSLQNYGTVKLQSANHELATKILKEAVENDDHLPVSHYNLALSYFELKQAQEAWPHVIKAVDLYTDKKSKSEAALLAAYISFDLQDAESVLKYAKVADQEKYMNYFQIYKGLLDIYLKQNELKLADDVADRLLALQPENVAMAETILTNYINNQKDVDFFKFLKKSKRKYSKNKEALGNLWFQEGRYYLEVKKDLKNAEKAYLQSKKQFVKGNIIDHPAFKTLDQILNFIKENK